MTKNPLSSGKVQRKIFFLFSRFLPEIWIIWNMPRIMYLLGPEKNNSGPRKKIFLGAQDPGPRIIFFLGTNIWTNPVEIISLDTFSQLEFISWIFFPVEIISLDTFSQLEFISWIFFPGGIYFLGGWVPESWEFDFKILGFLGPRSPENFLDYQAWFRSLKSCWVGTSVISS